jgi:hypothetical protein
MKKSCFLKAASSSLVGLSFIATSSTYEVKENDTLSLIVQSQVSGPIWGRNGSLKKVLKLNPQITNPDLIFPGEVIVLNAKKKEVKGEAQKIAAIKKPVSPSRSFHLEFSHAFTSLNMIDSATGADSELASKLHLSLEGKYLQHWSSRFKSFVGIRLGWISFENPNSHERSLSSKEKLMNGIGIGGSYELTPHLDLGVSAYYQSELFARSTSTKNVTIDAVHLPSLESTMSYKAFSLESFTLGVSMNFDLKLPAETDSYDVKLGKGYGGAIFLERAPGKDMRAFKTNIGFYTRSQDSSIIQQKEKRIYLGLEVNF